MTIGTGRKPFLSSRNSEAVLILLRGGAAGDGEQENESELSHATKAQTCRPREGGNPFNR
jgi:hypothetical protein